MAPDELMLSPALQEQLQGLLASAGVADGLQQCIDESAEVVADYTRGYTFTETRTNGWVRTLAVHLAFTRAGCGVPEDRTDAAKTARDELQAVRDGKFPGALSATAPAVSPGAAVTETADLDGSLR